MTMVFAAKSTTMKVSDRVPSAAGSASRFGQSMMVNSGWKSASSSAAGRTSRLRMNSECQAYSVTTRTFTRFAGSAPP